MRVSARLLASLKYYYVLYPPSEELSIGFSGGLL